MKLKWLAIWLYTMMFWDTILKQDNYFRTLEELPAIDGLHAYNDIQLFPELFDTSAVIERVTSEANLIEKQLHRNGITLDAPSLTTGGVAAKQPQAQQSQETSPGSSLQCGQETPPAPSDSQTPVQPDGSTTYQGTPTNNLPQHTHSLHP